MAKLSKERLDWFTEFMREPGRAAMCRVHILEVIESLASHNHALRDQLVGWLRALLVFYRVMLPKKKCCDSDVAGWAIVSAVHLGAKELLPEVKNLFATGLVADEVCGLMEDIVDELMSDDTPRYLRRVDWSWDIYDRYESIGRTFNQSN